MIDSLDIQISFELLDRVKGNQDSLNGEQTVVEKKELALRAYYMMNGFLLLKKYLVVNKLMKSMCTVQRASTVKMMPR
jgi:hypothetical protein